MMGPLEQKTGIKWLMPALGIATGASFFVVLFVFVVMAQPGNDKDILIVLVGSVSANMSQILSYYYGSSRDTDRFMQMHQQLLGNIQALMMAPSTTMVSTPTSTVVTQTQQAEQPVQVI